MRDTVVSGRARETQRDTGEEGSKKRSEVKGHACNSNETARNAVAKIVGIRVISQQIIVRVGMAASFPAASRAQPRQYAHNLKCFKMEIKRRLRALCKATRRALEYIIEQCQHLFLITFANGVLPTPPPPTPLPFSLFAAEKFLSLCSTDKSIILSFIRHRNCKRSLLSSSLEHLSLSLSLSFSIRFGLIIERHRAWQTHNFLAENSSSSLLKITPSICVLN